MGFYKPVKNAGYNNLVESESRDYVLGIGKWEKKYHGNRCAKLDYINLAPDMPGIPNWDERMDKSRELLDRNNFKGQRKYYHYVFSPDPKDNISVSDLSDALCEWCERCFQNKFEIVIGYHNDNKNNVQHAHMYINSRNLDPDDKKHTLTGYVTINQIEYARQLWQYMCEERGWHNFLNKQKHDIADRAGFADATSITNETDKLFKIDKKYFKKYKYYNPHNSYKRPCKKIKLNSYSPDYSNIKPPFATKYGKNYTKGALEAKKRGEHLWTDDLRSLIETAYYQSKNQKQFELSLSALDVKIEVTKNNDYKYFHPNCDKNPAWVATGAKLGKDYTKKRIKTLYQSTDKKYKSNRPTTQIYEQLITKIREIGYTEHVRHINPKNKDCNLKLNDIAKAMRINSYYNIWDINEYKKELSNNPSKKKQEHLLFAQNIMQELGDIQPLRQNYEKKNNTKWQDTCHGLVTHEEFMGYLNNIRLIESLVADAPDIDIPNSQSYISSAPEPPRHSQPEIQHTRERGR